MGQLSAFVKDFTLIILVAFAVSALYPHIQYIWNKNVGVWKPDLLGMWRDTVKRMKMYPTATILPLVVIIVAGFFLWMGGGDFRDMGDKLDRMGDRLDKIEIKLDYQTEVLEQMKDILLDIQQELSEDSE